MPINRGIIGHVEWKDNLPAKNIKVSVIERDLIFPDQLPSTRTDSDGNFIITYNPDQYSPKSIFKENPDLEIILEYNKNNIPKKTKFLYKNVKDEWLILECLKLDDLSKECTPIPEENEVYMGENIFTINLKDSIDVHTPENNDIWEVYIGSILEYSPKSIIAEQTTLKINSWGGKAIVADVIAEGSISKEEKKLNDKAIKLLEKRKAVFDEMSLLFNWLDKDGKIIHDSLYSESNKNFMKVEDVSIFIPKPTSRTEITEFLPVDRLEIQCRVIIKGKIKEFKIISMDSIQNLMLS
ncbi:MAG: hypothetical protein ACTSRP_19180 [Candidatus Helarchaeota archaeon]